MDKQYTLADFNNLEKSPVYFDLMHLHDRNGARGYLSKKHVMDIIYYYTENETESHKLIDGAKVVEQIMCNNPYRLADVNGISVNMIDYAVTHITSQDNAYDRWHLAFNSPLRCDYMIAAGFIKYEEAGNSFLREAEYKDAVDAAAKAIDKNTDVPTTPAFRQWVHDRVYKSNQVIYLQYPTQQGVISGYMTKSRYRQSYKLAEQIIELGQKPKTEINEEILQQVFDTGIKTSDDKVIQLEPERENIVRSLIESNLSLLTGSAGTGKSTLLQMVFNYAQLNRNTIKGCAWASKACFNLTQMTGEKAVTIMSLLYHPNRLRKINYLLIDEISMVPENKLERLLSLTKQFDTNVIMVGDKAQLPAVKSVGVMTSLFDYINGPYNTINYHNLTHVYRQAGDSNLLDAVTAIRDIKVPTVLPAAIDPKYINSNIKYYSYKSIDDIKDRYYELVQQYGTDNVGIITCRRNDVNAINDTIKMENKKTHKQELIGNGEIFNVGEQIMTTQNQYNVVCYDQNNQAFISDVFNGFVGTVIGIKDVHIKSGYMAKALRIRVRKAGPNQTDLITDLYPDSELDISDDEYESSPRLHITNQDGQPIYIQHPSIKHVTAGYAMTVHKAQGTTIPHTIFYMPSYVNNGPHKMLNRQLLYTAYTRAENLDVFSDTKIDDELIEDCLKLNCYTKTRSNLGLELNQQASELENSNDMDDDEFDLL